MDKKKSHFFSHPFTKDYISENKLFTFISPNTQYRITNRCLKASFSEKSGVLRKAKNTPHPHELGDAGWGVIQIGH